MSAEEEYVAVEMGLRAEAALRKLFRGDGTQIHYELYSNRGGRHVVASMDAAFIVLRALTDAGLQITEKG